MRRGPKFVEMAEMVIDFHSHLGKSNAAFYPESDERDLEKEPEDLLRSMAQFGIGKSVVFNLPMLPHTQERANLDLHEKVKGDGSFIQLAFLDPRLKESPELLERLIDKGFRGVKLHPVCHGYVVSHRLCFPTYEVAMDKQVPMLIHSGWGEYGEIRFIVELAKKCANLKIVIGHMIEKDLFSLAPPHENLFVESSYSSHPRRIEQAIRSFGADRVVFGSDYPFSHPATELSKIYSARLSHEEREKILHKNAEALLRLENGE